MADELDTDDTDEAVVLSLDTGSFTAPERLEVQTRFDYPFGGILRHLLDSVTSHDGPIRSAVVARDGTRWFPDQIIAHMLWVQARRTDPDVELAQFEALPHGDLNRAYIGGLGLGKAAATRSTRSSRGRKSAVSSEGG